MTVSGEICRLEYFSGAMATAYKGVITSLTARDLCIIESDSSVLLKGSLIALPEGNYQAHLMSEGNILASSAITAGRFEFSTNIKVFSGIANLQIDIVQEGRHIGTFLLKREDVGGSYIPAIELSEDLKLLDARSLTALITKWPGLLEQAERIIAIIYSAKKEWSKLSEEIRSFSKNLFWVDGAAFKAWFATFVRWSAKACLNSAPESKSRAVSNLLSIVENIIVNRNMVDEPESLVTLWLSELQAGRIDLAVRLDQAVDTLKLIDRDAPEADITETMNRLIDSVQTHVTAAPVLSETGLSLLRSVASADEFRGIADYSSQKKNEIAAHLSSLKKSGSTLDHAAMLEEIREAGNLFLDDAEMVTRYYTILHNNCRNVSGAALVNAAASLFTLLPGLSADASKRVISETGQLIKEMVEIRQTSAADSLLSSIGGSGVATWDDLLFNTDVVSAIILSDNQELIAHYKEMLMQVYVPPPNASGFSGDTWAEIVDPRHLSRLSKFLSVLASGGPSLSDITLHLIANLYAGGVYIPDDRLFQRDISMYLNSGALAADFLSAMMLLAKLPVYFNDVGAAGVIRDNSTQLDAWSNDRVLYFLRKQTHVNASNYNVRLIQEIIRTWVFNDPANLKGFVPNDVYNAQNKELLAGYSAGIRAFFISLGALENDALNLERLLSATDSELEERLEALSLSEEIRLKILLLCRLYRELTQKYSLVSRDIGGRDITVLLFEYSDRLRTLKEELLSSEKSDPVEQLYFKRHIAFGIPSVLGTYHEAKFDAAGEIFRTENRMTTLFGEMIDSAKAADMAFRDTEYVQWLRCLEVMNNLLGFHGISNFQIDEVMTILKTGALRLSQILDLLKIWQRELVWLVRSLTGRMHARVVHLMEIFPRTGRAEILARLDIDDPDYANKAADIIVRDMISGITGLTEMDHFIDILIKNIRTRIGAGDDTSLAPGESLYPGLNDDVFYLSRLNAYDAMRLGPVIGSKAKNLVYMMNKDLNVPPGAVFSAKHTFTDSDSAKDSLFREQMQEAVTGIEAETGLRFGNPDRPLLLAVRSGSYVSMPGILSTILYCGMNHEVCSMLAKRVMDQRFAWDSYRRFIENYATIVLDIDERVFGGILSSVLKKAGGVAVEALAADDLQALVNGYMAELASRRLVIPEDVNQQLRESIKAVYRSWRSEKAMHFRRSMSISEHWGTAVLLMQMIHANQKGSGASVFFTRRESSEEKKMYGDTREAATGDDLVRGRFVSRPLSIRDEAGAENSLERVDPELFRMHELLSRKVEQAMGGLPQEVEAAYTTGPDNKRTIYILQTKRLEFNPEERDLYEEICRLEAARIGVGIGVNGGMLSGTATFSDSADDIQEIKKNTGLPVVLLRRFSSAEDVSLMPYVDGILTAAGGATSHAAILAQKFGLTAVVCQDMKIDTDAQNISFAIIGNTEVKEGFFISIHGHSGHVYSGLCKDVRSSS